MEEELFTLKWNNHQAAFLQIIRNLRKKDSHTDATIACEGKFFSVHKFVLAACSAYFEDIFEKTSCKNPVVILKDIDCKNLEYILDYMYIGEVNVKQTELASLVSVAECLRIKGLAVPDEISQASEKLNLKLPSHKNSQGTENEYEKSNNNNLPPSTESQLVITSDHKIANRTESLISMDGIDHPKIKYEPDQESPKIENSGELTNFDIPSFDGMVKSDDMENSLPDFYSLTENVPGNTSTSRDMNFAGPSLMSLGMQKSTTTNLMGSMADAVAERLASSQPSSESPLLLTDHHTPLRNLGLKRLKRRLSQFKTTKSSLSHGRNKVNYICPHCSYSCQDNSNFKRHVQVHTGEKPYHCPFCKYSTIHSSNLKCHMRCKHSNDLLNRSPGVNYSAIPEEHQRENSVCDSSLPPLPSSVLPPV